MAFGRKSKINTLPHYMSLRQSLTLAFFFLILLPYLVTSAYYIRSMTRQLESEDAGVLMGNVDQLARAVDTMLNEADRVAHLHLVDSDIMRIMRAYHENYDKEYIQDEAYMINAIHHAVSLNNNIRNVSFFTRNGNIYQQNHMTAFQTKTRGEWLEVLWSAPSHFYVAPMSIDGHNKSRMPILYGLYDTLGSTYLGYVLIDYDFTHALESTLRDLRGDGGYAIVQEETIVYNSTPLSGETLRAIRPIESQTLQEKDRSYMVSSQYEPRTRCALIAAKPLQTAGSPILRNLLIYLTILGLTLLLDLLTAVLLAKRTGDSLKELTEAMDNAEHGNSELLDIGEQPFIHNEIRALKRSYNAMVQRLQTSLAHEYEARDRQNAIAARVLESQINPHFLYNSLNLIASIAQLNEQDSIQRASISLAEMLRYSIKEGSFVTLREELNQTAHYIYILKLRFPDRMAIQTDIDPALLSLTVPKLLIQPLLENAAKYATDSAALMVLIRLQVRRVGDELHILIKDNGPGIPPDTLAELRANIDQTSMLDQAENRRSMGILNVHARIRSYYGSEYGVHIESSPEGCTVTLRLPLSAR